MELVLLDEQLLAARPARGVWRERQWLSLHPLIEVRGNQTDGLMGHGGLWAFAQIIAKKRPAWGQLHYR